MRRSTSTVRRACAVGTTIALVGLTTGLGIMTATSASAAEPTTASAVPASGAAPTGAAPAAGAASAAGASTSADTGADTTPSSEKPSTETPTTPTTGDPTAPATSDTTGTAEPTTPATSPVPASGTTPATDTAPATPAPSQRLAAARGTVTIDGDATVGSTLTAEPTGFTEPTTLTYEWTIDGTTVSQALSYVVKTTDAGKVVTVTVANVRDGVAIESESAQTAPISQAPVFVDDEGAPVVAGTTDEDDLIIPATAGKRFSYTFRATGSPRPVLSLDYYSQADAAAADDDGDHWAPADQLPEGVSFDPATGVLSGSTTDASWYDFAVTATSGDQHVTQTVELDVEAGAPVGIEAIAADRADFIDYAKSGFPVGWFDEDEGEHSGTFRSWIIKSDGSIVTEDHEWESSDTVGSDFTRETDGGTPTVPQGGTLLLSGNLVDEFGNAVSDEETGDDTADVTVRSNVASDVVAADPQLGAAGFVGVTFPHASVHRLTVSASAFSTAFDVQVTPSAVPTVPTASTPIGTVQHGTIPSAQRHGRLAYTGADESTPVAWALGLLVAGVGLIGARTLRRRRAQR